MTPMFYDTANRAAGKQCFHLFCISSRSQSNVWICMSTHLENWDWVILNQQEVEQLVPDFKKYKMDSMFILLPQGITIKLVGVKHWRHSCFLKKNLLLHAHFFFYISGTGPQKVLLLLLAVVLHHQDCFLRFP